MKESYEWESDIAELLQCYLTEKQMTGFKFEKQGRELERFDDYYYRNGYTGVKLTKPMTDRFIYALITKSHQHITKKKSY